jgi:hypothetical protein
MAWEKKIQWLQLAVFKAGKVTFILFKVHVIIHISLTDPHSSMILTCFQNFPNGGTQSPVYYGITSELF